jgi:hypothetical protein
VQSHRHPATGADQVAKGKNGKKHFFFGKMKQKTLTHGVQQIVQQGKYGAARNRVLL